MERTTIEEEEEAEQQHEQARMAARAMTMIHRLGYTYV
jgi:hypothetical protein